jgi:glycosyltransferase involved in cell wall biosynthesis
MNFDKAEQKKGVILSIVVPLFNEESNVKPLVHELVSVADGLQVPYEIILVDDGSSDATWDRIKEVAADGACVIGISLLRNFGHQHALLAGLTYSHGQAILSMDGDLQHPPRLIPDLFEAWRSGYIVVNTMRRNGEAVGLFKRLTSRYFYKVFSSLSEVEISEGNSDFRLLDRCVVEALLGLRDTELFIRGAVQWLGFPSTTIAFDAGKRFSGTSKYGLRKMVKFASDAIVSFSTKPLRISIWLGFITSFLAFLEIIYVLLQYSRGETVSGWASTVGILSLLFGVLFIILGVIGSYLAWIHQALQNRPKFIIREITNLHRS